HEQRGDQVNACRDALGPGVKTDLPVPRNRVCDVIGRERCCRAVAEIRISGDYVWRTFLLFAPHEQSAIWPTSGEWIQRRLVRAFVEKFWQRLFFRTTNCNRLAIHDLGYVRLAVVQIADQD